MTPCSVPQEYPGPVPITSLSAEFLRQGERHLGVRVSLVGLESSHILTPEQRRPRNEEGESDNEETAPPE